MANQLEFQEKLGKLVLLAEENGNKLTQEEVTNFFEAEELTQEQMNLLNDYLLAKKIAVTGYVKVQEEKEKIIELSDDEQAYLDEYTSDLSYIKAEQDGEMLSLYQEILDGNTAMKNRMTEIYLPYIIPIAKEMHKEGFHIADLIQEGNVSFMMALENVHTLDALNKENIMTHFATVIKQGIQMLMEETTELRTRDQKMVEHVTKMDETITQLTADLGRKVTLEELSLYTDKSEEEILEVLKLMGEEVEEAPEIDFKVEEGKLK